MTRDPLDRLRDADPLHDHPAPDAGDPAARAMREAVLAGQSGAPAHRRRWIAGVAAAAAVATAAAIAVTTSRVQDPVRVGCYDAPSTQASTAVVQVGDEGPVGTCEALWATGQIDPDVTDPADVPPLVACTLDSGSVGVFPADRCDDVVDTPPPSPSPPGTPSPGPRETPSASSTPSASPTPPPGLPMPDYGTDDERVRRAMEQIRLALLDRCLTLDAAVDVAEQALADEDLQGWTVGPVIEDYPGGTCAGFFPDTSEQFVGFVPDEPQPGQTPEG